MDTNDSKVPRLSLALVAAALALAGVPPVASAATTIAVDTADDPGAPDCAPGHAPSACSLRGAVAAAAGGDTVVISPGINPVLTAGEVTIDKTLTIQGQGARATSISGNDASRIFTVVAGGAATMSSLTLTAGHVVDGHGGALSIANTASASLTDVAVTHSTAEAVTPGVNIFGGGIVNFAGGTLTLLRVTVSGNTASGTAGAAGVESPTPARSSRPTPRSATTRRRLRGT
jgi:hypothetical protein